MPIVISEIFSDDIQRNDERIVYYLFTFHNGDKIKHGPCTLQAGDDAVAHMALIVLECEQRRADLEPIKAVRRIMNGENPLTLAQSPAHTTTKKYVKALLRRAMRERKPDLLLKLEPLINYLRVTYTNTQLANFLDVTTNQLGRINTRYNDLIAIKTTLDVDELRVEDIE